MVNEENLDLEQIVCQIGEKYERGNTCAIVILAGERKALEAGS